MHQLIKQDLTRTSAQTRAKVMSFLSVVSGKYAQTLKPEQVRFLSVLANEVFEDSDPKTLVMASGNFAKVPGILPNLASKFASERIEIAEPMLRFSEALMERDLVEIIKSKSDEHRTTITKRDILSSLVTDTMLVHGNSKHALLMTRNMGAQFSEDGFKKLARIAENEEEISTALSYRGDMPEGIAKQMMQKYDPTRSRRLGQKIRQVQQLNIASRASKKKESANQGGQFTSALLKSIADTKAGLVSANDLVPAFCEADRPKELCQYIAGLSGLDEETVKSTLFKLNGIKIAQICKAIKLLPESFAHVAQLRSKHMHLAGPQTQMLIDQYNGLVDKNAERAIFSLRGKMDKQRQRLHA